MKTPCNVVKPSELFSEDEGIMLGSVEELKKVFMSAQDRSDRGDENFVFLVHKGDRMEMRCGPHPNHTGS